MVLSSAPTWSDAPEVVLGLVDEGAHGAAGRGIGGVEAVLVDGSRRLSRWAEDVLASMAWSFSHASTYVKGRSASVLFGAKVHALVHPGRVPEKVRTFNAHDCMEDFVGAFAALDGALDLVRGDGVRLLTVISDGYFGAAGQARGTQKAIDRFVRSGGQVLWIGQEGTHFPDKVIRVEINTREVAKVPDVVTAALTTALRRAA